MRVTLVLMVVLSVMILAVTGSRTALAQPSKESLANLRDSVEEQIRQLEAPTLVERARAERTLLDLGPDVLPLLPAPELVFTASARDAMKRIRVQLERRAARESALPSRVTFARSASVSEVLQQLTIQTRNRVELSDEAIAISSQALAIDYADRPFWECLDDLCARLRLRTAFDAQRAVLKLSPRTPRDIQDIAVQLTGPFRVSIQSAEIRPVVGTADRHLLRVTGRIAVEPRLRPLFLYFAAGDLTATAERKPLEPWNPSAKYELPVGDGGREVPIQLDFVLPHDVMIGALALHGRIALQLAAGTERIVFDKTSQSPGALRRRGGVTVRLRDVKFEPQNDEQMRAEIGVSVSYDTGGPAFESHRTWIFHNAAYLETESGKRFDFTEYDTTQQADGAIAVAYRWDKLAAPATKYKFVYEAPTLILDLPLDVKLDGIKVNPHP